MKHLKLFEKFKYKFKIGDIVRHISDRYENEIYKINDILEDANPDGFCYEVERIESDDPNDKEIGEVTLWSEDQMKILTEYDLNELRMKLDAKRYNL